MRKFLGLLIIGMSLILSLSGMGSPNEVSSNEGELEEYKQTYKQHERELEEYKQAYEQLMQEKERIGHELKQREYDQANLARAYAQLEQNHEQLIDSKRIPVVMWLFIGLLVCIVGILFAVLNKKMKTLKQVEAAHQQEIAQKQQELKQANIAHQQNLAQAQQKLLQIKQELELVSHYPEFKQNYHKELKELELARPAHQQEIARVKAAHQQEIARVEAAHQQEIAQKQQELKRAETAYKQKQQELERAKTINQQKLQNAEKDYQQKLAQIKNDLNKNHQNEKNNLINNHKKEKNDLMNNHKKEIEIAIKKTIRNAMADAQDFLNQISLMATGYIGRYERELMKHCESQLDALTQGLNAARQEDLQEKCARLLDGAKGAMMQQMSAKLSLSDANYKMILEIIDPDEKMRRAEKFAFDTATQAYQKVKNRIMADLAACVNSAIAVYKQELATKQNYCKKRAKEIENIKKALGGAGAGAKGANEQLAASTQELAHLQKELQNEQSELTQFEANSKAAIIQLEGQISNLILNKSQPQLKLKG